MEHELQTYALMFLVGVIVGMLIMGLIAVALLRARNAYYH